MLHHEICDLIPGMSSAQYAVLRDDIKERGLINEIVLYEGAILDGKHRHRACVELGIEPRFRQYEGTDPAGFVFSINVAHRHLEKGQLAMAGAKLKSYYAAKAKERMAAGGANGGAAKGMESLPYPVADQGTARDQAALKVGVSGKSVDMAEHIIKKGVPQLIKMVEEGEISLNKGLAIASMPKARQEVVVAMPTSKSMSLAITKSTLNSAAAKRRGIASNDGVPGTSLVRVLLSRLELITNEIAGTGMEPAAFAEKFLAEFDWTEPLLVKRLAHAQKAIAAIAALSMMSEQAKRRIA